MHSPHWIQSLRLVFTPPPDRGVRQAVGHAAAQGGGLQARQRLATKPEERPPEL